MSKRVIGFLGLAMLFALVAFASDPWKEKDFKDWDQKEVQKILADSPWVKSAEFGGSGIGLSDAGITKTGDAANRNDISGDSGAGGGGQRINFTISWASSRTFREAIARFKEFNGTAAEEARKNLDAPQETYIVLVKGNNLTGLTKLTEEGLKSKAYLMGKKSKTKVPPTRVNIQKGPDGKRAIAIIFEFPKKNATGEVILTSDEKGAEFFAPGGTYDLKIGFDFTKMADKTGSDW
jgi:hypothetical protein